MNLTRKDFELQWFSGTGKGGQHRNKHQNCCRIVHIATGLKTVGQRSRSREENLEDAFKRLAAKLIAAETKQKERRHADEVVRTYHVERGEVIDHATGLRAGVQSVLDGEIEKFLIHQCRENDRPRSGRA